jgi:hypothetical protein
MIPYVAVKPLTTTPYSDIKLRKCVDRAICTNTFESKMTDVRQVLRYLDSPLAKKHHLKEDIPLLIAKYTKLFKAFLASKDRVPSFAPSTLAPSLCRPQQ